MISDPRPEAGDGQPAHPGTSNRPVPDPLRRLTPPAHRWPQARKARASLRTPSRRRRIPAPTMARGRDRAGSAAARAQPALGWAIHLPIHRCICLTWCRSINLPAATARTVAATPPIEAQGRRLGGGHIDKVVDARLPSPVRGAAQWSTDRDGVVPTTRPATRSPWPGDQPKCLGPGGGCRQRQGGGR
jgi:hypothetical protein